MHLDVSIALAETSLTFRFCLDSKKNTVANHKYYFFRKHGNRGIKHLFRTQQSDIV